MRGRTIARFRPLAEAELTPRATPTSGDDGMSQLRRVDRLQGDGRTLKLRAIAGDPSRLCRRWERMHAQAGSPGPRVTDRRPSFQLPRFVEILRPVLAWLLHPGEPIPYELDVLDFLELEFPRSPADLRVGRVRGQ